MLDHTLDRLGIPLEDRGADPAVSVEVDSTPADENTVETVTEYMCDCGCCQPVAAERRVAKVKRPPVAILRGDGGYDSGEAFSHCRKRGVRTTIRVRIDANCLSDGKDRARSEAVLEQLGGGCTAARFARMGRDERKKHQKCEGRVQQQVDGGDHNLLVQAAAGRSTPGGEARVHLDRDRHQDSRV